MDKSRNFDSKIVFGFELEIRPCYLFNQILKIVKKNQKLKIFLIFLIVNYLTKTTVGTVNNILVDFLGNNRGIY